MTLENLVYMLFDINYIDRIKLNVSNPELSEEFTKNKIETELRNSLVIKDGHHYVLVEVDK